uniref:Uncharacterized protein n=2 Tax=Lotharella globosa TaxID=91324 RepID=A0A7S4DQR0_9EUKA
MPKVQRGQVNCHGRNHRRPDLPSQEQPQITSRPLAASIISTSCPRIPATLRLCSLKFPFKTRSKGGLTAVSQANGLPKDGKSAFMPEKLKAIQAGTKKDMKVNQAGSIKIAENADGDDDALHNCIFLDVTAAGSKDSSVSPRLMGVGF